MATPSLPIFTSPKTDSQLRTVLNRLQKSVETLVTDLGDLEDVFVRTGSAGIGAVSAGDVLYAPSTGNVAPALANADSTSKVIGVAFNDAAMGEDVIYYTAGVISITGVVVNTLYYLSADTPGAIVSTLDAIAGEYVVPVGRGVETDKLLFSPLTRILL